MDEAIESALHSITTKIDVLRALRENIMASDDFAEALRIIVQIRGKLIISGMGKSGHIGRKICATFQSTGQPAAFLHPAEAAHGDMGLIGADDCLVLLSNSGQTSELTRVASFGLEMVEIPIIAITANRKAPLAQAADCVLTYPMTEEGDPLNLAPMASTTAQLAIGDAIAAALMTMRHFNSNDFGILHHGGYLGRKVKSA